MIWKNCNCNVKPEIFSFGNACLGIFLYQIDFLFLIYKTNACNLDSSMSILCKVRSDVVSISFLIQMFVKYIFLNVDGLISVNMIIQYMFNFSISLS